MLSPYEQKALVEIEERKERELAKSPRRLVPQKVKDAASDAGDQIKRLPGAESTTKAASAAMAKAAEGVGKFTSRSSQFTLDSDRVLRAYHRRGNAVVELVDIHALDLQVVDRVAKFKRLNHLYGGAAMIEGAGAAAIIGGGELLATVGGTAGAGVAAAPGLGAIAAAVATDVAAVLVAGSRVVAHTALYYGYDPEDPKEEVFMMAVMGLGAATTQGAKMAAYGELSQLTQLLVRNAPWEQMNGFVLTKIANKFAEQFGANLTKKKLGQFVPVAGIAIGAGLNYATIDRIADAAYWTYRERFLREKEGEAITIPVASTTDSDDESGPVEEPITIMELLKDEGIDT